MLNAVCARDGSLCPGIEIRSMSHGQFTKVVNSINKSILHALTGAIDLGRDLIKIGVIAKGVRDDLCGILVWINEVRCSEIKGLGVLAARSSSWYTG